jgi:two-component system cell cycle response regulator
MVARVLVVDDILVNVKLLEAKLSKEYFDVLAAAGGREALEIAETQSPDIMLLDVMMPEMDGFEVCRRIKANPNTMHIPVVMVTALSDQADRVRGLEAGADDFLTKPVNDVALFARVRSLVRLKMMTDELRMREQTSNSFGVIEAIDPKFLIGEGKILIVEEEHPVADQMSSYLEGENIVEVAEDDERAIEIARRGHLDLCIISMSVEHFDPLRLCSTLRSLEETRQTPMLVLMEDTALEQERLVKAMELGVNDYIVRPVDENELIARCRTQIRRKHYEDRLRENYHASMALAVTDSLTGLYNRRYVEAHLNHLLAEGRSRGFRPVSFLMLDIDHFKVINDTYGHAVGDDILREFANRMRRGVRGVDMAARFGGEEFVVVMPDTDIEVAARVAERLREDIGEVPFIVGEPAGELSVTVSIGASQSIGPEEAASKLLARADKALYDAKHDGRNQVVVDAGNRH